MTTSEQDIEALLRKAHFRIPNSIEVKSEYRRLAC